MSDSQNKQLSQKQPTQQTEKPIDKRCPRQLDSMPSTFCALAVQRLKALRHSGRELTEEEESKLPGCPYAVNHQLANYCFFKLIENYIPDSHGFSDMEVAHFLNISTDTVKKIEKKAVQRMRDSSVFKEIIDIHDGDQVMEDTADFTESDFFKE
jgi:hypothetical protein